MATCDWCDAAYDDGDAFCQKCGKATDTAPPREVTAAPVQPVPVTQPAEATPPARRGARALSVLRRIAAGIAAVAVAAGIAIAPVASPWEPRAATTPDVAPSSSGWAATALVARPAASGRVVEAELAALTSVPEPYQGRLVRTSGVVGGVESAEDQVRFAVVDGDASLTALYPASRADLKPGMSVTLAGVLAPGGDELLVLAASPSTPAAGDTLRSLAAWTLGVAIAFFLGALLVRVRRGRTRRRSSAMVAAMLLPIALLLLAGCEIKLETLVRPDGSGRVTTRIDMGEEAMDQLKQMPNSEPFIESWKAGMATRGTTVAQTGGQIRMVREFSSETDFDQAGDEDSPTWTLLKSFDMPDGRHFAFLSHVDTNNLYVEQGRYDEDGSARDELNKRMGELSLAHDVRLPGTEIAALGGDSAWSVPMGGSGSMFCESVVAEGGLSSMTAPEIAAWWRVGLRYLLAATAGLLAYAVLAYPWRKVAR